MKIVVSFLILVIGGLWSCKPAPDKITKGTVRVEGPMDIAYQSCGTGDTTLLFIHGWCINKEYWQPQFDHFCDRYKVVALDVPGFGQSGKNRSDWSFDTYARDVKQFIDQLKLKNVILIGHSMSGDIVLKTDAEYPENIVGLIGVDNLQEPGRPMDSVQLAQADSFFKDMLTSYDATVKKYMPRFLFQPSTPDTVAKRVMNDILATDHKISVEVSRAQAKISETEQDMMRRIHHPLCLVNSDVFPTVLDSLNKYCAHGSKVYLIPGSGHYPMIEQPEAFNRELQNAIWKK